MLLVCAQMAPHRLEPRQGPLVCPLCVCVCPCVKCALYPQGWRHSFQAYYRLYNLKSGGPLVWLTSQGQELIQNVVIAPENTPAGVLVAFIRSNDVYIVNIDTEAGV